MLRPVRLSLLRSPLPSQLARTSQRHQRRLISFAPPSQKPRSFKGSVARWALAGGALYWYATRDGDIFAEDARARLGALQTPIIIESYDENEQLATVDAIHAARRERQAAKMAQGPITPAAESAPPPAALGGGESSEKTAPPMPAPAAAEKGSSEASSASASSAEALSASPAGLEEEAESQGAFNEETGEINWDCPCLGGMAHGPCGEQFREAFSCFVYSKEEPKGVDCIERFKTMQDCFREHPDVYGAELTDEPPEDDLDGVSGASDAAPALQQQSSPEAKTSSTSTAPSTNAKSADSDKAESQNPPAQKSDSAQANQSESQRVKPQPSETPSSAVATATREGDEIMPKATYDARDGK